MAGRWRNRNRGIETPPTGAAGAGVITGLTGCLGIGAVVAIVIVGFSALLLRACADLDLNIGPDPGDGTSSARLPVVVTPRTKLQPDQVVRVRSEAFTADSIVGIAQCLPEADTDEAGVAACDVDGGSRFAVGPDGTLDVPFPIRRVITVGGEAHDCSAITGGCLVVAADATDFNRSGGQRVTFATGLGPVVPVADVGRAVTLRLPVTIDPAPPYRADQKVSLRAEGFVPGEPLLLAWCTEEFDRIGPVGACEPEHMTEAFAALGSSSVASLTRHADAEGVAAVDTTAKGGVQPFNYMTDSPPVRCTSATPCRIVIAAPADPQRSAVVEYSVAG